MPYYLFAASALALIVIVIFLRYILPITPDILPNFHKINSGLYRGGQPSKKGLLKLKGLGVKTIISLRSNFVLTQREKVIAEKLNMMYYDMHTGAILGITGKILVFIVGLICASLPVTGFIIWLNRYKMSRMN